MLKLQQNCGSVLLISKPCIGGIAYEQSRIVLWAETARAIFLMSKKKKRTNMWSLTFTTSPGPFWYAWDIYTFCSKVYGRTSLSRKDWTTINLCQLHPWNSNWAWDDVKPPNRKIAGHATCKNSDSSQGKPNHGIHVRPLRLVSEASQCHPELRQALASAFHRWGFSWPCR